MDCKGVHQQSGRGDVLRYESTVQFGMSLSVRGKIVGP